MELDAQEVKCAIQLGRSRIYSKNPFTDRDFSKGGSKFCLLNTFASGSSIEEATLDHAARLGLMLVQLITLVNQWNKLTTACCELQQIIHKGISMFDCGLSALYIWEGRTFIDLSEHYPEHGHAKKGWEALAKIQKVRPASERNRTEILIYQAKAAFRLEDLDLCCTYLEEGVKAASILNSRRRYSEALEVYQSATLKWPMEQQVKELQEIFVTFRVI